jgi:hypothetical protein
MPEYFPVLDDERKIRTRRVISEVRSSGDLATHWPVVVDKLGHVLPFTR